MSTDTYKRQAAERALEFVEPGMRLGLGTGSTARHLVELLGARVKAGLDIVCVPTSEATRRHAAELAIPLATLDEVPNLDLTIDGADEIDPQLRLIKGGGGALLREKIVAMSSDRMIVIADPSKLVRTLGRFPLPVEVVAFGLTSTRQMLELVAGDAACAGEITLRRAATGEPFVTDGGHYILDCAFGAIPESEALAEGLLFVPGVVETGLFLGVADLAIVAGPDGIIEIEAPDLDDETV
ncbi:MAG: ribose-5-phosphate isomerase RpiA [Hyphomicrobiaceae bacterium]